MTTTSTGHDRKPLSLRPVLKNIFSNWVGLGLNLAVGFFMAPYTVHKLGETQYGIWALVLQLTGYMGVFDVGLRSALVRFISRARTLADEDELNSVLSSTMLFNCMLALLALIVGFGLSVFALTFLKIPAELHAVTRTAIILATITLAVGFPMGMFQAVLAGASRWDLSNGVGIITLVLRTIAVIVLLEKGYGLVALAAAHLLTSLLGWSVGVVLAHRVLGFRLRLASIRRQVIGPILSHSSNSLLISVANRINYQIDSVVISLFLPVHFVTIYVIGFELVRYFRELLNGASQVIAPVVTGLDTQGRADELRGVVLNGGKYILLLAYFGATTLLFVGPYFIGVWMGAGYIESSGPVLQIIALSVFASATAHIPSQSLYGLGKHRVNVWCTAVEAVINLSVSLTLIRYFGIYGVAAGTLVSVFIVRGFIFPAGFLKIFGIGWRDYVSKSLLRPALNALFLAAVLAGFVRVVRLDSYPAIIATVLGCAVIFAATTWVTALDAGERARARRFLQHSTARLGWRAAE